jgi:hypothetical protein
VSTTQLTSMAGISLNMQCPLTSHIAVCLKENNCFVFLPIKLHALIRLGVYTASFDTSAQNGVL